MTRPTPVDNPLDRLIDYGLATTDHEQLPWDLATDLVYQPINQQAYGLGLLTLTLGIANWGVDIPCEQSRQPGIYECRHDNLCSLCRLRHDDPANLRWTGQPKKSGKHLTDYQYGGLGLAHFDSGALQRFWEHFQNTPLQPPTRLKKPKQWDFNVFIKGPDRHHWLDWFSQLVIDRQAQRYMLTYWLERFWLPVWQRHVEPTTTTIETIAKAAVNTRITNSVPVVAKRVTNQSTEKQIQAYKDYKRQKRGDHAADRAQRQANFALRVPKLFQVVRIEPL